MKLSDRKAFIGALLLILARIGLFVVAVASFVEVIAPQGRSLRLLIAACIAVAVLVASAFVLTNATVLWQVGLQSIALAGVAIGLVGLFKIAGIDPHLLLTASVVPFFSALILGVASALLMRWLQTKKGL